jgi:GntR family transcriptional regulator/MocR family aminotransferase
MPVDDLGLDINALAATGLDTVVVTPAQLDDEALAARARTHGVGVHPLSWHRQRRGPAGLVIGYGACPPDRLREAVRRLGASAAKTRGVMPRMPADDARIDRSDIARTRIIS